MIVQSAPEGDPYFVMIMPEHTALAGQLARAFGNARFEPVEPRDEVIYTVDHHDHGWVELDAEAPLDPKTRLPYNLVETPLSLIAPTSAQSPDFNGKRHACCGLLSSMHSWGLYNGRYGLSDFVILDKGAEAQTTMTPFLDSELERQERLKAELARDPETAAWIEDKHLFQKLQGSSSSSTCWRCTSIVRTKPRAAKAPSRTSRRAPRRISPSPCTRRATASTSSRRILSLRTPWKSPTPAAGWRRWPRARTTSRAGWTPSTADEQRATLVSG